MNRRDRRAAGSRSGSPPSGGSSLFTLAVQHHHAGQLLEAETFYRQVLAADRKHVASLHHLGIIALQRGQPQAAIDTIGRAIAIDDRIPDCHYNIAFALHALGRSGEAVAHYQRAVKLKPDYVEAHTNLGNVLREIGNNREAVACYERVIALKPGAEAYYNLANAQSQLGRLDEAVTSYQRSLALNPDLVGAHNNLANALVAHGRPDDALIHFRRALELNPKLVEAHVNLGTTLLQQDKLDAAAAQFERALSVDPNFADAHANLGNVHLVLGRLDEAAQCYRRALALKPDLVEPHNNLGIVLAARGDFQEAGRRFEWALARKPDFIDAYNNLARAFLSMGQADNALGVLRRALAIGETAETKSLFVQCARVLAAPPDVEDFRALLIRALTEPWGRANDLASVAARVVKQDGAIGAVIARAMAAWPRRLAGDELLGPTGLAAICRHRLLRCLMESAAIGDVELERLLTGLRFALLELACAPARRMVDDETLEFCCALARQCFLNEQVFAHTEEEFEAAQRLRESVFAALASGAMVPELHLAVVAAYFPLHTLPGAEALLDRTWSDAITGSCSSSRCASQRKSGNCVPRYRRSPRSGTKSRSRSGNNTRKIPIHAGRRRSRRASRFCSIGTCAGNCRRPASKPLARPETEILIAGCGTGQHAIETAQRFAGAHVLAVDLSLTSLAYAQRKTHELDRTNVDYRQADILQLGSLGRSFDLIEFVGRAAPSRRSVCRLARAPLAPAPRRLHGGRPLQRDRARGHRCGSRLHRRARLSVDGGGHQAMPPGPPRGRAVQQRDRVGRFLQHERLP